MCTRVVYLGPEDSIITARSMDWKNDMGTNLWAFPRGMNRDEAAGPNSIEWTSKYGSVVATCFDNGSADGINEAGLVANMLYLAETEYPTPTDNDPRKPLALSAWAQYVLDNYATVDEAVKELEK
jgi:penicillin V acylase-like amidase (Ntn superfamily)